MSFSAEKSSFKVYLMKTPDGSDLKDSKCYVNPREILIESVHSMHSKKVYFGVLGVKNCTLKLTLNFKMVRRQVNKSSSRNSSLSQYVENPNWRSAIYRLISDRRSP